MMSRALHRIQLVEAKEKLALIDDAKREFLGKASPTDEDLVRMECAIRLQCFELFMMTLPFAERQQQAAKRPKMPPPTTITQQESWLTEWEREHGQ